MTTTLDDLRIVVGSYDGWLYGWESSSRDSSNASSSSSSSSKSSSSRLNPDSLKIAYAYEPHVGCVKSAASMTSAGGDWLATGGSDETIRVYNLRRKRDMGALHSHAGAVTCLEFFGKQHLLSGSDDGTLRIWRVSDWACLHVLGGHKSGVTSIAIHPTGRLALSTSSDKTVRLWNLMEGRNAYISRLTSLPTPEKVQFSLDGMHYALLFRNQILVYGVATGEIIANLEHDRVRLSDFCYLGNDFIVTGADDGRLRLWSGLEDEGTLKHEYDCGMGNKERIKGLTRIDDERIAVLFSSGLVQIWDYQVPAVKKQKAKGEAGEAGEEEEEEEEEECSLVRNCSLTRVAKTGSRATCLASCTYDGSGTVRGGMGKIATTGAGGGDDASYGECERWCFHWHLLFVQCVCFLCYIHSMLQRASVHFISDRIHI